MHKLVEWSDDLSVGIQEIDEQHKILVGLLNQLNDSIHEHHASAATRPILNELAEYTRVHFAVEESLMRVLDYPDYETHKREHEELVTQIKDLQSKLDAGDHSITFELLNFLKGWLTTHIIDSDKHCGSHFLSRGIAASWKQKSWVERLWGAKAK